ncbi:MAG: TIGR04255 family protein [Alphaproteobacteria bacterium]|jgi:uncharacterized protein (TIGR04255 family)
MAMMPNAPLRYVIGVVRFPKVPRMERYVEQFLDAVRSDYPLPDEIETQSFDATVGPDGMQVRQSKAHLWQFASPDKQFAFLLSEELFALHTNSYVDHLDFVKRFGFGLKNLIEIPEIKIGWVQAIGVRYVDLVAPRKGEQLSQYLRPEILPFQAPLSSETVLTLRENIGISSYKTTMGEMRVQTLWNPPTTLPPELETPLIERNGWRPPHPDTDFLLLDLDHGARFAQLQPLDVATVCEQLAALRAVTKELFLAMATDFARRVWEDTA